MRIGYLMQNGAAELAVESGPQLHAIAVIEGLRRRGHDVRVMAIQGNRLGWSDAPSVWNEPRYGLTSARAFRAVESVLRRCQTELSLPYLGAFDSFRFGDACVEALRGVDVLYERHGFMGYGGVVAARRMRVPLVLELNGNIVREIDEIGIDMSPLQRSLGRRLTWWTFRAADHVVVVAESLKGLLVETAGVAAGKISVVVNGTNTECFTAPRDSDAIRQRYGLGSSQVVAHVGSFQPWHGVELLVSAFALLHSRHAQAVLVLVGTGAGDRAIKEQVSRLGLSGRVIFTGQLPQGQVADVLSTADVAVAPYPFLHTDIVGTPLKLLEYMAAGCAIVASTVPLHALIVHGETGLRVPPADPVALAGGISSLLEDRARSRTLGANARREALSRHSWNRAVEEIDLVLRRTIENYT